jgi:hypothetical protein
MLRHRETILMKAYTNWINLIQNGRFFEHSFGCSVNNIKKKLLYVDGSGVTCSFFV